MSTAHDKYAHIRAACDRTGYELRSYSDMRVPAPRQPERLSPVIQRPEYRTGGIGRPARFSHARVAQMVRQGISAHIIAEEAGYTIRNVRIIAEKFGLTAKVNTGAHRGRPRKEVRHG